MMNFKPFAWMMAIAIASTAMTACSLDSNEPDKPFTTCPEAKTMFYVCETNQSETRSASDAYQVLFTEDDIEWFNVTTREIKFKEMEEPLYMKLMANYGEKLEFHLGENVLFEVSRFVSDFDSRIFTDLVLHFSMIGENEGHPRYYLDDCYPLQFVDTNEVKANRVKNAGQWELFIYYLESKGKLKK